MKTAILSILTAIVFATNVAKADDVATFNLGKTDVKVEAANKRSQLMLELKNTKPNEGIRIQILDNTSTVVHDETMKGNQAYAKTFDMSIMADGVYQLVVIKSNVKAIETFRLRKAEVQLNEIATRFVYTPTVKQEASQVLLHMLLPEKGNVQVTILDENLKGVWTKKYRDVEILSQVFDISQLASGKYQLVIKSADGVYYKEVLVP